MQPIKLLSAPHHVLIVRQVMLKSEISRGDIELHESKVSRKVLTQRLEEMSDTLRESLSLSQEEKKRLKMSTNWNREVCQECGGHGEVDGEPCPECGGTGLAGQSDERQYPRGREVRESRNILK